MMTSMSMTPEMVRGLAQRALWFGGGALVKGTLLLLVTAGAVRLLRRAPASVRHLVWALGLAAALVVPVGAWLLPSWHLPDAWFRRTPVRAVVGGLPVQLALNGAARGPSVGVGGGPVDAHPTVSWPVVLVGGWALVALALAVRVALDLRSARRLRRRAREARDPRLLSLASEAAAAMGLWRLPPLLVSQEIDSPATVGVLRPAVLVPVHFSSWTDPELRAALAHELAHARRGDCATQSLARIVCAAHWPSPLAWLAAGRLLAEREMAADDAALRAGTAPSACAGLLLRLAAAARTTPLPGGLAMAGPSPLRERVARLLEPGRSRAVVSRRSMAAAAVAVTAMALSLGCFGGSDAAPSTSSAPSADRKPLWLATTLPDSTLGRRLTAAVDDAARAGGLETAIDRWQERAGGPVIEEPHVIGPRERLAAFVAAHAPATSRERVLLDERPGGRARTVVVDLTTRVALEHPELFWSVDQSHGPLIDARLRGADARRVGALSTAGLHRRMAIVVGDDRLLAAPQVESPFSERFQLFFNGSISAEEVRTLTTALGVAGAENIHAP